MEQLLDRGRRGHRSLLAAMTRSMNVIVREVWQRHQHILSDVQSDIARVGADPVSFTLTTTSSSARSDPVEHQPVRCVLEENSTRSRIASLRVAYTLREAALHHGG
jgi:hypothetical protein